MTSIDLPEQLEDLADECVCPKQEAEEIYREVYAELENNPDDHPAINTEEDIERIALSRVNTTIFLRKGVKNRVNSKLSSDRDRKWLKNQKRNHVEWVQDLRAERRKLMERKFDAEKWLVTCTRCGYEKKIPHPAVEVICENGCKQLWTDPYPPEEFDLHPMSPRAD